jgi:nickel transport protein
MPAAATAAPGSEQEQEQKPPEPDSGQPSVDEGVLSATVESDHASETQGRERATASGQVFDAKRPVLGTKPQSPPARLDPAVAAEIERAVARQVRPLREALAQAQGRAQLRDILGGVGYILGIAGIGIWWSARQRRRRDAASEGHG